MSYAEHFRLAAAVQLVLQNDTVTCESVTIGIERPRAKKLRSVDRELLPEELGGADLDAERDYRTQVYPLFVKLMQRLATDEE